MLNENYIRALSDLVSNAESTNYFIVGSVALLSFTQSHGYDREIHDIDVIMDTNQALKIADKLKQVGYSQNTFINPRMPFYSKLMQHAANKYLRFSKDGVDIEILATSLEEKRGLLLFEMYPGVKAGLPKGVLLKSSYSNVEFRTVSKEMLFFFKKLANNTVGRKVKYKQEQRYNDMRHLENLIDRSKLKEIIKLARLYMLGIPIKIPEFLLK